MNPETRFRVGKVDPFLKKLSNCWSESIQQKSIRFTPDKILCINGLFISLEIKTDEGRLSPGQELKNTLIRERGRGIALIVYPSNWEQIKTTLKELDSGRIKRITIKEQSRLNQRTIA